MKPASEKIDHISVESQPGGVADPWQGISADVIRRFVDVLCTERGVPKGLLSAYRADLDALDRRKIILEEIDRLGADLHRDFLALQIVRPPDRLVALPGHDDKTPGIVGIGEVDHLAPPQTARVTFRRCTSPVWA